MKKAIKIIALVLCAVLVLGVFLSESYVFINSHHSCVGDGCVICRRLHNAEAIIERLLSAFCVLPIFCILTATLQGLALVICKTNSFFTLVEQRVRLNN